MWGEGPVAGAGMIVVPSTTVGVADVPSASHPNASQSLEQLSGILRGA